MDQPPRDLSFDEFRAVKQREISKSKFDIKSQTNINPSMKKLSKSVESKSSLIYLGDILESFEAQFVCIILIILDSYSSYLRIVLLQFSFPEDPEDSLDLKKYSEYVSILIDSFIGFTQVYFTVETIAIVLAFGSKIIGHVGYTIDILVIGAQFYLDIIYVNKESRILNLFRLWRLYRLFVSLVNIEKSNHEKTKEMLENCEFEVLKLKGNIQSIDDDLAKEKEARQSVEDMLQNYKEEVDTLNEALKIAARDIAEVAEAEDDLFFDEDEDEDKQDQSTINIIESKTEKEMPREGDPKFAITDSSSLGSFGSSKASASTMGKTFIVHSDGSFEHR